MGKAPKPASAADQGTWRADAQYAQAEGHINRIFDTRILYVYGLGLVANAVSDLFNHFLHLRPVPVPEKDQAEMVFTAVGLLGKLPLVGEVLEIPLTVAEKAYDVAKTISPEAPSSPAMDIELEETLKHEEMATPLFQRILWMRWDIEQKKADALAQFRETLIARTAHNKFSGTPLSLAKEMFGDPLPQQDRDSIYKLFLRERDRLFKSVMMQYVKKYVSIFQNQKQFKPYGPTNAMVYYSIRGGINDAQWRFIYSRFGKQPDLKEKFAIALRLAGIKLPTSKVSKDLYTSSPAPDPTLTDLSDLSKLWGAKVVVWQQSWYGGNSVSEW